MKVLLINGSPHKEGNTFIALSEVAKALEANGVETEIVSIGAKAVQGCIACGRCAQLGRCVFNDELYGKIREKLETADGIVVGSPVYYAGPNGSLCALLDRLFYSAGRLLAYKPAASVAVCRRGGASATFDRRYRGVADYAYAGAEHGLAVEELEAGRRTYTAQRALDAYPFHSVASRRRYRQKHRLKSRRCFCL